MLNFESSDLRLTDTAAVPLADGRDAVTLHRLARTAGHAEDGDAMRGLARDFAEVFYTLLVKEMKITIGRDDNQDVVSDGVSGFIAMFLPRSMAQAIDDPLTKSFHEHLTARFGQDDHGEGRHFDESV